MYLLYAWCIIDAMNNYTPHGTLVIARHGESEWNALGKWTGTTDVDLTEKGMHEAQMMGEAIRDIPLHYAYHSEQRRTLQTLEKILHASNQGAVTKERRGELNERDYGDYTGMNKWEVQERVGDEVFNGIRRAWDYPVPGGETLKDVYGRVVPFYEKEVLPKLVAGDNIILVAHGNSIRSLIKHLEDISDEGVSEVEMPFGEMLIYHIDETGRARGKQIRLIDTTPPKA